MRKATLILILIILTAVFLRFYQITSNPKAMYGDGITLVYDAYSILKTGQDQRGNFLPVIFGLGGGRPGGYIYATIPFVALFGPTALAGSLVSILSGIGIVFLLYLLGKELISENAGLAIAAVAALNPWELSMSRGPFESHFALFLALLGFYGFIRGFRKKYYFLLFGLAFGLSVQTYATYQLNIPVFALLLLILSFERSAKTYHKNINIFVGNFSLTSTKNYIFLFSLFLIISSTILGIYITISRGSEDRFSNINIFKDPGVRSSVSEKVKSDRLLDSLSLSVSNSLHNAPVELAGVLVENYFKNLLPDFLFMHGDGQVRHNPAEMGEFFWVDTFFLILGIIYIFKTNRRLLYLLTGWIIIAPVATSLVGGPHALRSSFLLPPILILIGTGLYRLWLLRKKRYIPAVFVILGVIFAVQTIYFFDRFYFIAPQKHARSWSYPAKKAFELAFENRRKFDTVIISNDIDNMEFAYPTYAKLDPNLVIKQNQNPTTIGEYRFFNYDNVYIGSLPHTRIMQFVKSLPGTVLYIGSSKEESNLENYKVIRGFDKLIDLVITTKAGSPDFF